MDGYLQLALFCSLFFTNSYSSVCHSLADSLDLHIKDLRTEEKSLVYYQASNYFINSDYREYLNSLKGA